MQAYGRRPPHARRVFMTPDDTPGATSLRARMDQPLIAIPVVRDGREEVLYFVNEAEADAALGGRSVQQALALAGAWSDLDAMLDALDHLRHESAPTPALTDL